MTDHYAEANRLISATDTRDWNDPSPYVDRRIAAAQVHATLAALAAQAEATLALENQQRIANLIALWQDEGAPRISQEASSALVKREPVSEGYGLKLRPDIARTLRIETT